MTSVGRGFRNGGLSIFFVFSSRELPVYYNFPRSGAYMGQPVGRELRDECGGGRCVLPSWPRCYKRMKLLTMPLSRPLVQFLLRLVLCISVCRRESVQLDRSLRLGFRGKTPHAAHGDPRGPVVVSVCSPRHSLEHQSVFSPFA